jgi:hypothetical protein
MKQLAAEVCAGEGDADDAAEEEGGSFGHSGRVVETCADELN